MRGRGWHCRRARARAPGCLTRATRCGGNKRPARQPARLRPPRSEQLGHTVSLQRRPPTPPAPTGTSSAGTAARKAVTRRAAAVAGASGRWWWPSTAERSLSRRAQASLPRVVPRVAPWPPPPRWRRRARRRWRRRARWRTHSGCSRTRSRAPSAAPTSRRTTGATTVRRCCLLRPLPSALGGAGSLAHSAPLTPARTPPCPARAALHPPGAFFLSFLSCLSLRAQ